MHEVDYRSTIVKGLEIRGLETGREWELRSESSAVRPAGVQTTFSYEASSPPERGLAHASL